MSTEFDRNNELFKELANAIRLQGSLGTLYGQAVAERLGVHHTDMETMDFLNIFGPMTAGRLSELTGLTSGATTRLIDRLERAGYIRRTRNENDRRQVIIEATPERIPEVFCHFAPMGKRIREMWTTMSPDDLRTVLDFVRKGNAIMLEENKRIRRENAECQPDGEQAAAD